MNYRFIKDKTDATLMVKALEQMPQEYRALVKENDTHGALGIEYYDGTSWKLYAWWR